MTKIRCAVIEGSHRCESSCCLLQGHHLGDPIPLVPSAIEFPSGCTLFKPVQTHVYYPRDSAIVLDKKARSKLKDIGLKQFYENILL